jgi:hypothetical protein
LKLNTVISQTEMTKTVNRGTLQEILRVCYILIISLLKQMDELVSISYEYAYNA